MGYLSSYFDSVSPVEYKMFEAKNGTLCCLTRQGANMSLNKVYKQKTPKTRVIEKEYYDIRNQDWSYPEMRWPNRRTLRVYKPTETYCPIAGYSGAKPGNGYVDIVTLSKQPNMQTDSRLVVVEAVKQDFTISRFKLHLKKRGSKILENNNSKEDLKQLIKGDFPATIKKYAGECLKLMERLKPAI